jgi:hypothetical protein
MQLCTAGGASVKPSGRGVATEAKVRAAATMRPRSPSAAVAERSFSERRPSAVSDRVYTGGGGDQKA